MNKKLKLWLPFSLTAFVVLTDQLTKWLIVKKFPLNEAGYSSRVVEVLGDIVRFVHVRNTAIAFGLGQDFSSTLKLVLFISLPIILLIFVMIYYFKSKIPTGMRWVLTGILGGGIGNMIDRIFRPAGVVDFIDVKVFGLFGFERWPTFNIADSSVVVAAFFLAGFLIKEEISEYKKRKEQKNEQKS